MKPAQLFCLALATATLSLSAFAQSTFLDLADTGAGGAGRADPNWSVFKFSTSSGLNVVTGSAGIGAYLGALNAGTLTTFAGAVDARPYSSAWITPTVAGDTWLSLAATSTGQASHDPTNGGGYAFVFDLGAAFAQAGADLSKTVSFSFQLNGDNGFSAHVTSLTGTGYVQSATVLGSTAANFGSASGAGVSYSGLISQGSELVIVLSNDYQTTGNPGGILVQNFSGLYTAVPEPSTCALLLGVGVLGWLGHRRVRRNRAG